MPWVKRNLGLVIGAAIALVLMVLAGFYLWQKYGDDQAVTAELETTTTRYKELLDRPLHPGTEQSKINNIELARQENKRLEAFLADVRAKFGKREIPTNMTDRDFRALLDNTIYGLQRQAETLGVALPIKDYWFTFAPQRQAVSFKNMEMLTHQLLDIKDLTELLYAAKVHDLKQIRRVPASTDDNNQTDFLSDKKPTTNDFVVATAYELRFQGFSSELARVMEGLINAKRCYVIRSVAVDKADATMDSMMTPQMGYPPPGMRPGIRPYMPQPVPGQPGLAPRRPPNVLLDESKLLFVLMVDAIRLRDLPPPGAAPAQPPAEGQGDGQTVAAQ
jgi:hypothetical protein